MRASWARAWFGLTALTVLAGLVVQVVVTAGREEGAYFPTAAGRVFNMFCFFTVQSNILVGVTCLLLALRLDRSSTVFRTFRFTALVCITITGVVYHLVLAGLTELTHWALVADTLLHTVVPLLAIAGWLLFGPRGQTDGRIVRLSLIFPVCWLVFVLIRGALIHYYPYPFLDVDVHGYARVLLNCAIVAVLFVAVAAGAAALDRALARWRGRPAAAAT